MSGSGEASGGVVLEAVVGAGEPRYGGDVGGGTGSRGRNRLRDRSGEDMKGEL